MRWLITAILCLSNAHAQALAARNAAYYCTPEAASGLSFDNNTKKWVSARFKPDKAFVLKFSFESSAREKMFEQAKDPSTVNRFRVTSTDAGSTSDLPCFNRKNHKSPVEIWDDGWVQCNAGLSEIIFNPETLQFLKVYLVGYVDGVDNNDDTPSLTGGVCTKIN